MERIRKRQDQIVAFLKTQEKNILEPSLMGMVKAEERMKFEMDKLNNQIATLTSTKDSKTLTEYIVQHTQKVLDEIVKENNTAIERLENKILNQIERQNKIEEKTEKALLEIVKFLDKKDKEGLAGRVKNLFG